MQQVPGEMELEDTDTPQYFDVEKILRWQWTSKTQQQRREFLVCGRGIQSKRLSGSPRHTSVIRTHFEQTLRPTGFLKSNEAIFVSVDRNSSRGGSSCGKSWC